MTPKLCPDEDGDIPPCSVMYDFKAVENWEREKQSKYEFKVRKAPCSCLYFDGEVPSDHKCFIPQKYPFWKRIIYWLCNYLRAFRT